MRQKSLAIFGEVSIDFKSVMLYEISRANCMDFCVTDLPLSLGIDLDGARDLGQVQYSVRIQALTCQGWTSEDTSPSHRLTECNSITL